MKNFTKLLRTLSGQRTKVILWVSLMLMVLGISTTSAQIALRGTATTSTSTTTSITINKPTGVVTGDVMFANIGKQGNSTTAPSLTGWTLISGANLNGGTNRYGAVLYKVATASEATSYTFALGTSTDSASGGIIAFSGVDVAGGIFDAANSAITVSANGTTAVTATGKTTVTDNAAIIMFGQAAGGNPSWTNGAWSTTSPGALLELFDVTQAAGSSAGAAWATKTTPGATGNGAATLSSSERNGGLLVALKKLCPPPTITTSGTITSLCSSGSNQTTSLAYSATTNTPTAYSIDWNAAANTAGLADQSSTAHTFVAGAGNVNTISVTGGTVPGTYSGIMTLTNAGGCTPATQAISLTISGPTVGVGGALSAICQGSTSAALGGSIGGTATGGTWSDGGVGGTFNPNATTLNATWTSPTNYSGSATLTLTTSGGSCGTTSAGKTQVVNGQPTATAGGSQTICSNGTATVSGATSSNGTISWAENGAGSITSGATTLTPVYTAAAGDAGNTVTLTMTVTNSPCTVATATYTVIVKGLPTATAGGSQSICVNGTATVSGATSTNGTISWTENGAGSITSGGTTLTPVYTPAAGDAGNAVTLTMSVTNSPCTVATATYTVNVKGIPTATAGGTQTICPGLTATVSGATSSNGTISWVENGAGSITSGGTTLTPVYTSAAGDAGNTVTLTMTVTNSPCAVATATYTVVVSPAAPAAPGVITGSASVCAGATTLSYSIAAVTNATNYTWTVPSGWSITNGQGTTAITATAGSAGTGTVTVVASNSCGSTSPTTVIDINPLDVTNATGYTNNTVKTDGNMIVANQTTPIRRGYVKFPLTALPAGAVINSAVLTLQHNGTDAQGSSNNSVTALGNNDPTSASASTLYSAINSGTSYSSAIWTWPSATSVTLNATASTDIQSRIATGYIAMGLLRATTGTAVYNFYGHAAGANAPKLTVSYGAPRSLTVTTNPNTTNGSLTTSACDSYTWSENGQTYNATGVYTNVVGCNTATLNLTIIPTTTNGSVTTSACGSYTWASNGQTYNTTGVYTNIVGCNTATLDITITPNTTTGSLTTSACDSYTWSLNGQTYNATGVYTHVVGCNTATLNLTVTPSTTTGSLTTSACDSYTWPLNGQTYNATGVYTHIVGCNTATLNLTITPSTTVGSLTTSACDTYTWSENGQTYTATGVYTNVVGCNTATLNLTITPSTTNGSLTTSACDSYTWSENGQTYNATGVYTNVVGCNTATLNLTVSPSTTVGSLTTSACDTYTWSENGQTYNATGVYTNVVGCNTATLNLTITPSTTVGSLTTSACDTYTWSENGQTYTATGVYTNVVGCNTATLNLTITPSTTNGSLTTSACDSYTWSENGQTYNATGVYTHVVGCNTATLDLTITPSTTNGSSTQTACVSYTWPENGQTYTASGVYTYTVGCNTAILNLTVNTSPQTFYADTDGDGFGSGAAILSCTGQPANTSINNTDCAPADAAKWRTGNFFIDVDGDTYNNGFPASPVCYGATIPAGHVAVNYGTDCDDTMSAVNPNASEVLANGIDDNCDGTVDEVTPTSNLINSSCGITLENLSHTLFAYDLANFRNELGPVQAYRFRVTDGVTVRTYDSTVNRFSLPNMNFPGGVTYGTTYTVEVSAKTGGHFRAYGSPCTVTTPAVPNGTFITNPISGSTLSDISNTIFCKMVPSASGYRFRVSNGNTVVGTFNSNTNRFSLVNLGISNIAFGTTYTIDVLLKFGSQFRPDNEYGPTAQITTPATPGTSRIVSPSCGTNINNLWTTIFAQQVIGAQGYKFVVTNGVQTREFATSNARFSLQNLAGGAAPNTTYTIRVDVLYSNSYVVGTSTCNITTLPTATRQTNVALDVYEVNAYPNPYVDAFKLNVNTSSEDQVSISVYDMLGREIESRKATVMGATDLEIGSRYPSGVYNVIVTQGDHVKTLRVIKR